MIGRRTRSTSSPEGSSVDSLLTLAVYYRSDSVEQHIAPLRAASGLHLEIIRKGAQWAAPVNAAGVLWELTLDDGAHRLVSALTSQAPSVSYSTTSQQGLVELSRSVGLEHYEPMRYLSVTYPLALAVIALFVGLSMYRLRYLSRVTT